MDRISELEARIAWRKEQRDEQDRLIASDTAELERLKAEPDWERYRGMLERWRGHQAGRPLDDIDKDDVRALLAARNYDPDVMALVEWVLDNTDRADYPEGSYLSELLAPFAAIKGD